ncbi:MAG: acyl-CoA thioesterase [Candidatus Xenobia bacterium]
MERPSKKVEASRAFMQQVVMPNDTNPRGTVFGGRVLEWIDICGAIAAQRHCRSAVVTVSIDEMSFLSPIKLGHVAILSASVNFVGTSSLEVGVRVDSEDPLTGRTKHCSTAYLTYVALDADGQKIEVPGLELTTDEDRRRWEDAAARRLRKRAR